MVISAQHDFARSVRESRRESRAGAAARRSAGAFDDPVESKGTGNQMRIAFLVSRVVLLAALPFVLSSQDAARLRPPGYLTAASMPDLIRVLPSAPAPASARDAADRAIFK